MNENDLYKDATPLKERAKNETVAYHLKPDVPWDLINQPARTRRRM